MACRGLNSIICSTLDDSPRIGDNLRIVAIRATQPYEGHPCSDPGQSVVKELAPHSMNYA